MASTGSSSSTVTADVEIDVGSDVEIVVGLASDDGADMAARVAGALRDGLARYCPARSARFVWAEAGSPNGAGAAVRDSIGAYDLARVTFDLEPALREWPYHGRRGRVSALRAILLAAQRLNAQACIVVDAALETVRPEWIERLVLPIVSDGFDYVSAYYQRQAHRGALTKAIVYPVVRSLYGVRLRQPAAAEFGCSRRLMAHYLEQGFWDLDDATAGIDLWLTTAALAGGFRACEADLGALGRASGGTRLDLGTTLAQVVGALFTDLERRA